MMVNVGVSGGLCSMMMVDDRRWSMVVVGDGRWSIALIDGG